ncbi:hypothetical protein ABT300_22005 [Streptomyces sp. NPDC001027]|uniref:hypothetical protein n=1 Tax=Streptomyces sp. NPDC001027 TaxID=3154771 RepID=UPI00331999FF
MHYDRWWNPAVEDQATDRAYRIGSGEARRPSGPTARCPAAAAAPRGDRPPPR